MPPTSALGCLPVISKIKGFHGAVRVLNSLQSNVLDRLRKKQDNPECQLLDMYTFLSRTGLTVHELDKLNIIHVTGTKGKGSTCAFTERILRNHGLRTGFYSSPHLVHVRERIRINGQPISKDLFTKYFWEVYEQLAVTKDDHGGSMPFYFQFLTLMAFHVFLLERVDLAVIEVGIGGQYDCTNIVRRPWVCGISSLGIDHASLLGHTVERIAWQKAGIFKPGVPAFTVRQPSSPLSVLQDRADEIGCPLRVCPELEEYECRGLPSLRLGLAGQHQRANASLALQLSHSWLQRQEEEQTGGFHSTPAAVGHSRLGSQASAFQPSRTMLKGLQETEWLGRSQTVRHGPVTYCIDGAHTTDSIQACAHWFTQETSRSRGMRVLLFNTTGDRDSAALLKLLVPCQFDYAVFCPNVTETPTNTTVSSPNAQANSSTAGTEQSLARCLDNQNSWLNLSTPEEELLTDQQQPDCHQLPHPHHHQRHPVANSRTRALVFPCILTALQWISQGRDPVLAASEVIPAALQSTDCARALRDAPHISVLVTGSLYLVGGVLQHLVPSLESS